MTEITELARNNWPKLLSEIGGINPEALTNKHQPCPVCGGHDRYRFDDKEGRGTYHCNQCGAGDGMSLLQKVTGKPFKELAIEIEHTLGISREKPKRGKKIIIKSPEQAIATFLQAPPATTHPYLTKKQIKPYVARLNGDELLIPMYADLRGTLHSVQRILPEKDQDGTDKRYIKGTEKKGKCCIIGELKNAELVILVEGYATGATVHELTERPVIVCFDAGNVWNIAEMVRRTLPEIKLLIASDADGDGQKAKKTAQRFSGLACFPDFTGTHATGNDFNDLAVYANKETARQQLLDAIENTNPPSDDNEQFRIIGDYIQAKTELKNGETIYYKLCGKIEVIAAIHDQQGLNHGRLLHFKTRGGKYREWAMPVKELAGDSARLVGNLMSMGLAVQNPQDSTNCKQIAQYINSQYVSETRITTDSTGWHDKVFVLPRGEVIGTGEKIVFTGDDTDIYQQKGNLQDWLENVGKLANGNSRLQFAVSMAFVGVLMPLTGDDGAGVNFYGETSTGKTTTQIIAASVWGKPTAGGFISKWNATATGLEIQALQRNHTLFCIDELGEVDAKPAGRLIYQLASGVQKGRGKSSDLGIGLANLKTWKMPFISSGEKTLQQHVESAGERLYGGQSVRCVDIPANAGAGYGVFEELEFYLALNEYEAKAAGEAFSDAIKSNS
jgi:putative DNA primase/helicase